jgi:hypothetical protein
MAVLLLGVLAQAQAASAASASRFVVVRIGWIGMTDGT